MGKKETKTNAEKQQDYEPSTSEINDVKYKILVYTLIIGFLLIYYAAKNKMSDNTLSNFLIIIGSRPHLIILCIIAIDLTLFNQSIFSKINLSNNSSLLIKNYLIKKYQKKHPQPVTRHHPKAPPVNDPRFDDHGYESNESYDDYADRHYDEYDDWGEY